MEFRHIEGKGKPIKVVAPISMKDEGITKGKEYMVTGYWWSYDGLDGHAFHITDDYGRENRCLIEKKSVHLNGGNWIVTEREQS